MTEQWPPEEVDNWLYDCYELEGPWVMIVEYDEQQPEPDALSVEVPQ